MGVPARSLRRNFLWTLSGNVVYAACMWGILSVLTKLGSPETVGRFSLASAVATPVIMFANLQLRPILASDAENAREFADYLGVRLFLLPLALLVVAAVAAAGYSGAQVAVILVFAVARVAEGVSDVFYGYDQKHERMDLVARSIMIKGVSALVLFTLAYRATQNLVAALGAMALAFLVPLLVFDIPRAGRLMREVEGRSALRPAWNRPAMLGLMGTALPLGLVMLLIQLRNTIPRTQLESAWGEGELGVFAAMSYLTVVGTTFVTAMAQSIIARLARANAGGDAPEFRRLIGHLVRLGLLLGAGGVAVAAVMGRWVLTTIYSPEYAARQDVFIVVMIAGGFLYLGSLLGAPVTAAKAYRVQLWIQGVNVPVMFATGALLIPEHGMMGAAWAMVAGAVWITVGHAGAAWRAVRALEGRRAV